VVNFNVAEMMGHEIRGPKRTSKAADLR